MRGMLADQCESASAFIQKEPHEAPQRARPSRVTLRSAGKGPPGMCAHGTRWQLGPKADSGSSSEARERGSLAGTRPVLGLRSRHGASESPARGARAVSTVLAQWPQGQIAQKWGPTRSRQRKGLARPGQLPAPFECVMARALMHPHWLMCTLSGVAQVKHRPGEVQCGTRRR